MSVFHFVFVVGERLQIKVLFVLFRLMEKRVMEKKMRWRSLLVFQIFLNSGLAHLQREEVPLYPRPFSMPLIMALFLQCCTKTLKMITNEI